MRIIAYHVWLRGKIVDTVFYGPNGKPFGWTPAERAAEVKRSLVNHDGYTPNIVVTEER